MPGRRSHRVDACNCGRGCWRWRLLLNLVELVMRKWKGVMARE